MLRRTALILTLTLVSQFLFAQGPLAFASKQYLPGDTLDFEWDGTSVGKGYRLAALHVWIDDLESNRRWKFRYPIVNGKAEGALVIPKDAPGGRFALTAMGAEQYLEVRGKAKKVKIKTARNYKTGETDTIYVSEAPGMLDQDVNYIFLSKQGILFDSTLHVASDGSFRLPPIIFGDTASLVFKPERSRYNYVVEVETPLDSAFTPFHTTTVMFSVKGKDSVIANPMANDNAYNFTLDDPYRNVVTMDEVIVTGKAKAQQYEEQYVSQTFRNNLDGKTFSGIDNDEISRFNNLLSFLQSNVPGLMIRSDGIMNSVTWRNDPVTFFIDEIRVDANAIRSLPATEIAMIKTYPPPATMTSFVFGGGIAIYTKRGSYANRTGPRYGFPVQGYTQGLAYWLVR